MTQMKTKWMIEKEVFEDNFKKLTEEIRKQGLEYKQIRYRPFEDGMDEYFKDEDCVLYYGSLELGRKIQKYRRWVPGVINNAKNLECSTYFNYFGQHLLNKNYAFITIQELLRQKDFYYSIFGKNDEVFVRPNSGMKQFTGGAVKRSGLTQEALGYGYYHEDLSLLVVVSEPKQISCEWRVVIGNKKVITGSQNKINGELEVSTDFPKEVEDYAQSILGDWQPDKMFIMDIAECQGSLHLIELNSFSSSGLYDCDLGKIVEAASKIALEEWREIYE